MSATDRFVPLAKVAEIAERAYRRGFQQGHRFGKDGIAVRDLHHWRYHEPIAQARVPDADTPPIIYGIETALDRLEIEEPDLFEIGGSSHA